MKKVILIILLVIAVVCSFFGISKYNEYSSKKSEKNNIKEIENEIKEVEVKINDKKEEINKAKEDNKEVFDYLERILLRYDQIADNYQPRDIFNVYSLLYSPDIGRHLRLMHNIHASAVATYLY